jgi:YHS domain-containing protein
MLRNVFFAIICAFALVSPASAGWETQTVGASGYDLVAYQTENKPVRGDTSFMSYVNDTVYLFANKENKAAFDKEPARYLPAYGGYCAFGMSNGYKVPVDPEAFTVVDNKLYLNFNKQVRDMWSKDIPGRISKADENWSKIMNDQPVAPQ